MTLKEKLIDSLSSAYPGFLSVESLANQLALSQDEVKDLLTDLNCQKFPIQTQDSNVHLNKPLLSKTMILNQLETDTLGSSLQIHAELDSTNTYAKENLSKEKNGEVIFAHRQTSGKGRLGRNWTSPAGNSISMSLVLKPDIKLNMISLLTQLTAAALVKAIEPWANAEIKWPNDIVINKKKIAGILVETEFSGSDLRGIVIGVGINTNSSMHDFPDDLKNKATSIKEATGQEIDPNKLAGTFLNYFEKLYTDFLKSQQTEPFLSLCRKHSALIGKDYWIIDNDDKRKATIRTIDESGGLVVTYNDTNETETITSTALSIRGDESYL